MSEYCKNCAALQAKIDALMLEYCPAEIAVDQLAEWAAHQKPVTIDQATFAENESTAKSLGYKFACCLNCGNHDTPTCDSCATTTPGDAECK